LFSLSGVVEVFTFVLTSGDSKWTFGYCRHPPGVKTVTLFLSFLPWQEIFYRTLNYSAELDPADLVTFLERMYVAPIPEAGTCIYIPMIPKPFVCACPSDFALPSIPENVSVPVNLKFFEPQLSWKYLPCELCCKIDLVVFVICSGM